VGGIRRSRLASRQAPPPPACRRCSGRAKARRRGKNRKERPARSSLRHPKPSAPLCRSAVAAACHGTCRHAQSSEFRFRQDQCRGSRRPFSQGGRSSADSVVGRLRGGFAVQSVWHSRIILNCRKPTGSGMTSSVWAARGRTSNCSRPWFSALGISAEGRTHKRPAGGSSLGPLARKACRFRRAPRGEVPFRWASADAGRQDQTGDIHATRQESQAHSEGQGFPQRLCHCRCEGSRHGRRAAGLGAGPGQEWMQDRPVEDAAGFS